MSLSLLRPAALRLRGYGPGRRGLLIAAALAGSVVFAYGAKVASRGALLQVVRACVLDQSMTGSPLPCLKVAPDYVVLRPPFGPPDTILTPTEPISGIEDPKLQAPGTPNYFALAWKERGLLQTHPPDGDVTLAVNSVLSRSQDQMHIHIGCATAEFADRLRAATLGPRTREWFRAADLGPGLTVWTYRSGGRDFANFDPFRLVHALVGGPALKRTVLAVALHGGELVAYALPSAPGGWHAEAEDVLRAEC